MHWPDSQKPTMEEPSEPSEDTLNLLNQVRKELRLRRYSVKTEEAYVGWIKRFKKFSHEKAELEMSLTLCVSFLEHLASSKRVANSTLGQARNAMLFLFTDVLKLRVVGLPNVASAQKPKREPTVLAKNEIQLIVHHLKGVHKLMAMLVYGSGINNNEVVRLLIEDVNFDCKHIMVRDARGGNSRLVPLPESATSLLQGQILAAERIQVGDPKIGLDSANVAGKSSSIAWFLRKYLFPSAHLHRDPRTGYLYRSHATGAAFQSAFRRAKSAGGIDRNATSEALRHSFIIHMLAAGADVRTLKEILGHKAPKTTLAYKSACSADYTDFEPSDLLPTVKICARLAWINRFLRSGISLEEIRARRWARDEGDYSIYCLAEDGKRVRYFGITNQAPSVRLRQHLADLRRGKNIYKENWLRSCAKRGIPITMHIVRTGLTAERAAMMEFELIRFFKSAFSLVNTHAGGATGYAGLSAESREKHRINTEKGLIASATKELELKDLERGYCLLEEWQFGEKV